MIYILAEMPQIEMWVTGGGAVREGSVAVLRCAARVRVESRGDKKQSRGVTGQTRRDAGQTHGDAAQTRSVVGQTLGDAPVTHAVKITLRWYKDGEPIDLQVCLLHVRIGLGVDFKAYLSKHSTSMYLHK